MALIPRQIARRTRARVHQQTRRALRVCHLVGGEHREAIRDAEQEYKAKGDQSGLSVHIPVFDVLDAVCKLEMVRTRSLSHSARSAWQATVMVFGGGALSLRGGPMLWVDCRIQGHCQEPLGVRPHPPTMPTTLDSKFFVGITSRASVSTYAPGGLRRSS